MSFLEIRAEIVRMSPRELMGAPSDVLLGQGKKQEILASTTARAAISLRSSFDTKVPYKFEIHGNRPEHHSSSFAATPVLTHRTKNAAN